MHAFQEGAIGFFKPALDFVIAIFIYAFAEFFKVIASVESTLPKSHIGASSVISASNAWIFLGIFAFVAVLEEILLGISVGYSKPINAVSKIIGIILGTWFFWEILVGSYHIIGGSENDMIIAAVIAIAAMCLGVCLRFFISRNPEPTISS